VLKDINTDLYDPIVISPRNYFLFTPLLASTTVGTLEFRSIIEPVRAAKHNVHFYQANIISINLEKKFLECEMIYKQHRFNCSYDKLVIAVGMVSNTFGISGVEEYALFLKDVSDARNIRKKIIQNFEMASEPGFSEEEKTQILHFVVVGGGPTGVEFAAELHDFLLQDVTKSFPEVQKYVAITLLEANEILNSFDKRLRDYTMKHFKDMKINVKIASVKEVKKDSIVLGNGEILQCGLVVWSTGITARPLIKQLPVEKDKRSRITVDEYLRVLNHPDIYAIGDCSQLRDRETPQTAQMAQQEGKYVAKHLNKIAAGKNPKPYVYVHRGMLAYIGSYQALADLNAVKAHGFLSWFFWRSAYLTNLVSFKNKLLVPMDWLKTIIFGRDISRFE